MKLQTSNYAFLKHPHPHFALCTTFILGLTGLFKRSLLTSSSLIQEKLTRLLPPYSQVIIQFLCSFEKHLPLKDRRRDTFHLTKHSKVFTFKSTLYTCIYLKVPTRRFFLLFSSSSFLLINSRQKDSRHTSLQVN